MKEKLRYQPKASRGFLLNLLLLFLLSTASSAVSQSLTANLLTHTNIQEDHNDKQVKSLEGILQSLEKQQDIKITYQSDLLDGKQISVKEADELLSPAQGDWKAAVQKIFQPFGLYLKPYQDHYYIIVDKKGALEKMEKKHTNYIPYDEVPLQEISTEPTFLRLRDFLQEQQKNLSGKVTDLSDGTPLPGVNVLVKNTTLARL